MNISELIKEAHGNAVERGFYPEGKDKNIGELLMLIVSELGEALEAHRNNRFVDVKKVVNNPLDLFDFPQWKFNFDACIKDTFEDEIADVFIRLFDLCGYLGIELKEYPDLEMQCFKNIGQEFLWWTATLSNLPGFIEYYRELDDIKTEIQEISLVIKRMETFCQTLNIPIEKHIKAKMAYNRTRPHKHGKEY